MEINDLIIFKTVANEGSISKAAVQLGYVQPNISERIKKLEEELGTRLFFRNSKGVTLLPSGEVLLDYTNRVLFLLEEAKNEIKRDTRVYRIATTQSILSGYVRKRIQENIHHFQIYMEHGDRLLPLLKRQSVDLVISYADYSEQDLKKVFSTTVAMGLLKAKGRAEINYSTEVYFVSHDKQCPYRNRTLQFMESHSISRILLNQVDSYSLIQEFVAQGKGIAFLPIDLESLEVVEEVPISDLSLHFYTLHTPAKSVPAQLFS